MALDREILNQLPPEARAGLEVWYEYCQHETKCWRCLGALVLRGDRTKCMDCGHEDDIDSGLNEVDMRD